MTRSGATGHVLLLFSQLQQEIAARVGLSRPQATNTIREAAIVKNRAVQILDVADVEIEFGFDPKVLSDSVEAGDPASGFLPVVVDQKLHAAGT
jgi:hypothetical protein